MKTKKNHIVFWIYVGAMVFVTLALTVIARGQECEYYEEQWSEEYYGCCHGGGLSNAQLAQVARDCRALAERVDRDCRALEEQEARRSAMYHMDENGIMIWHK